MPKSRTHRLSSRCTLCLLLLTPLAFAESHGHGHALKSELPAAIIGEAGPLTGEMISYYPADKATQGYLAVPEGPGRIRRSF